MSLKLYAVLHFVFIFAIPSICQEQRVYTSTRLISPVPVIDGSLNDACWANATWQGDFLQFQPSNGKLPHQNTEFAIVYDDNNIYVAIKAFDSSADSIQKRLTRKDQMEGDMVGVAFDSYHDKRTAFCFVVNAGGVKSDFIMSNDGENSDNTWDPIWYVTTNCTTEGWFAEMKIPLSQLRFEKDGEQVWGFEVLRNVDRYQELSFWQNMPRESSGMVHLFGELKGISGIQPRRQVELAPYVVAGEQRSPREEGNPFHTGSLFSSKIGIDGKIGLTNNIIMDFTIHPDFGQVEADPAQLNLSAYETYYKEQRPFFIEGKNIYSFPLMIGDGDMSGENVFYSRRIGRAPQLQLSDDDVTHVNEPSSTDILGAAKISGKTKKGLSIGVLECVTSREFAETDSLGFRRNIEVEPLTNYLAARVQKDYNDGNTLLGGIFTATNRDIDNASINFLTRAAYTGGFDLTHYWNNKNYYFTIRGLLSKVQGSRESLINLQESSARYFQRPDAHYIKFDSTRTAMAGHGGRIEVGRTGGSKFTYGAFVNWKSPGLELNDLGYLRDADMALQILWGSYQNLSPKGILREFRLFWDQFSAWDFGATNLANGLEGNANLQFTNYWRFSAGFNFQGNNLSKSMLRGGPYFKLPGGYRTFLSVNTDDRKKIVFTVNGSQYFGLQNYDKQYMMECNLLYRPFRLLQVSIDPQYMYENSQLQYVDTYIAGGQQKYLFASINQHVLNISIRINLTLLPNLSIQYWGQPFIASGKYSQYKLISDPRAANYADRFHLLSASQLNYDPAGGNYSIDEDQNGLSEYYFSNPDFNWKDFKSNLVLKWEYVPGSDIYLVWSQDRNATASEGNFSPSDDLGNMFRIRPTNIFLVKIAYRFHR